MLTNTLSQFSFEGKYLTDIIFIAESNYSDESLLNFLETRLMVQVLDPMIAYQKKLYDLEPHPKWQVEQKDCYERILQHNNRNKGCWIAAPFLEMFFLQCIC